MSEKLKKANRMLDHACKNAGMDPVAVRVAMFNAIMDGQRGLLVPEAPIEGAEEPPTVNGQ